MTNTSVPSYKGKINVYICSKCGNRLVTIDRDHGVTPFKIPCEPCRNFNKAILCITDPSYSMMTSCCYNCDQSEVPTHEWRLELPDNISKDNMPSCKEHLKLGGMFLFKID